MEGQKQNPILLRRKQATILRCLVQVLFFLLAPAVFSSAFAGVKEVFSAFSSGALLEWSSFTAILVLVLGFTVVFGRFFCGYACAFGALGDWIYSLSAFIQKKCHRRLPKLPAKVQRGLQWVKFVVLAVILLLCVLGKQEAVNGNSPWTVFSLLRSGHGIPAGYGVAIVLLVIILLGMAVQERFFCQFLCPLGAIFSLLPVLPTGQLRRAEGGCLAGCSACEKNCPVTLKLERNSLRSGECVSCGRCGNTCPRGNVSTCFGKLRGTEWWFVLVRAAALLAGIWLLQ